MTYEEALEPAATGVEGNDRSTNTHEGETIMTIIPDTAEIREAIRAWAHDYVTSRAEQVAIIEADPGFQAQAAEEIAKGPWTMADCVRSALTHNWTAPSWPAIATPWWVVDEPMIIIDGGGEVSLMFTREFGAASIDSMVAVVIDDGYEYDKNHPGAQFGDLLQHGANFPTLTIFGEHEGLSASEAARLFDSLAGAVALLRRIEANA